MAISLYQASAPVFIRLLGNLGAILGKAAAHAEAKKIEPAVMTGLRLMPDMFPLSRQVQIATDMAKGCVARLSGAEPPKYEDSEVNFVDLQARIEKTIAYIKTIQASAIDGAETRDIVLTTPRGKLEFKGLDYLLYFVLPNFYFHVATAYNILRANGVEIGKMDFLGAPR